MSTLHIHVDESGNLDFTPRGTRFYIFTAAWTYHPAALAQALTSLRFRLIKHGAGANLSRFHAAEDAQECRDQVVETMLAHPLRLFASVVVEKRKVNPAIRQPESFYPKFLRTLLLFILRGHVKADTSRVLVFTDTLPLAKRNTREAVSLNLEALCQAELRNMPVSLVHHASDSNPWLQVADYCCWSICRKWESGDLRTYDLLKSKLIKAELDVLERGSTRYY